MSNAARYISDKSIPENWIKEVTVTKVGRKYIEAGGYKFNIEDDFRQVYTYGGADYELYLSKDEILYKINSEKLYREIRSKFSRFDNNGKYTLEQLEAINEIINQ